MLLSNDDDDGSSCFCAVFLCSVWYVVGAPQTLRRTSFDASKKNKTLCLPVIDHGDAVKVQGTTSRVECARSGIAGLTRSYLLATVVAELASIRWSL